MDNRAFFKVNFKYIDTACEKMGKILHFVNFFTIKPYDDSLEIYC